jgi:hypothetical protein
MVTLDRPKIEDEYSDILVHALVAVVGDPPLMRTHVILVCYYQKRTQFKNFSVNTSLQDIPSYWRISERP